MASGAGPKRCRPSGEKAGYRPPERFDRMTPFGTPEESQTRIVPVSPSFVRTHFPSGDTATPWTSPAGDSSRTGGAADRPVAASQTRSVFGPPDATSRPSVENAG